MGESTYPVLASVKWVKTYQAATASPLRPADVFHGHMLFVALRLTMNCAIFLAVAAALGRGAARAWALAALPVAVLTGLTFNAVIEAWAITRTRDTSFAVIFRFGMIPLFLFSGTFFPVTQLPAWLRPVAYVTPLWHGVALCRSLSLGTATLRRRADPRGVPGRRGRRRGGRRATAPTGGGCMSDLGSGRSRCASCPPPWSPGPGGRSAARAACTWWSGTRASTGTCG